MIPHESLFATPRIGILFMNIFARKKIKAMSFNTALIAYQIGALAKVSIS